MSPRTPLFLLLAASAVLATPAVAQRGCSIPAHVLVIGFDVMELAPGQTQPLSAGLAQAPYVRDSLPRACRVRWSVDAGAAARVDARGRLTVDARARPGTAFVVRAVVGRDTARQPVHVIDPRPNPLAGTWSEAAPAACTPAAAGPGEPVRELVFHRDGRFELTFTPFEAYKDYWGRYTWNAATGALGLQVENGNNPPADADLDGTARVADRTLTLEAMWLGQPGRAEPRTCTYHFTR